MPKVILFHLILGESGSDLGNIMLFSGQWPSGILFVCRMEGRILVQQNVCGCCLFLVTFPRDEGRMQE